MKSFISLERFPDEEQYQIGRIQFAVALAALVGFSILIGYRLLIGRMGLVLPLLAVLSVILASTALLLKGHLKLSGSLLSWTLLGFLGYILHVGDGIHDVGIAAVPAVLIIAALILSRSLFFLFTSLSLLSIVVIGSPEIAGVLAKYNGPATNVQDTIDLVIILGITTVTVRVLSDSLIRSLVKARNGQKELRKQTEQLGEAARRYQALFEGANDAIFIINSGRIVDCNTKAVRMFGFSNREEILNSSPWDISPERQPDGQSSEEKALEILRLASSGIPQSFYWKYARRGGAIFDAEVSLSCLQYGGEILIQALVRDITERKEAEERIIRSEEHYRALVNASPDAISIADMEGRLSFASPNAMTMFGVPPDASVLGMPLLDWVAPEDRQRAAFGLSQVRTGEVDRHGAEYKMLKYDGSWFWTEAMSTRLLDSSGFMTGILTVIRDISERKESEQALQESEELHRKIITTVPDFIIRTDLDGYILFVNETAFPSSTPITTERLLGKNLMSFVDEEDRKRAIENSAKMLSGQLGPREYLLTFEDGSHVPCEVNGDILRSSDGTPYGRVYVVRDVTQRKQEEETRKKLELQLFHGQKLESVGTLAAGIAHDFNNVLSIIMGNISLIANCQRDEEKFARRISAIERATARGAQVVKQLLTYARKTKIVRQSVDARNLIREVMELLDATLPKSIEVVERCAADVPPVFGDMNQLHQVLLNLSVNARDAMPGGGRLTITSDSINGYELSRRFPNALSQRYVRISVADSGTGMNEDTRKRMFDPFFTTKEAGKGTGLGLAVVHGIIENHHGFIEVESQLGKGTEFSIYLPAVEQEGESKKEAILQFDSVAGGTETILLVEDELLAREFISEMLAMKGYNVITAVDGEEGMAMFGQHGSEISLIISDMDLPKLNGEELCRRVKQVRPDLPVIIVSGFVDPAMRISLGSMGVGEIHEKPFKLEELLVRIRTILHPQGEPDAVMSGR